MDKIEEIKSLADAYFKVFNLTDWTFQLTNAKTQAGYCNERKKIISMSIPIINLNPLESAIDTLKHEIAHALVGCVNGHNSAWKATAARLGATPKACHNDKTPDGKFLGICNTCENSVKVHRRRKLIYCYSCKLWRNKNNFTWLVSGE